MELLKGYTDILFSSPGRIISAGESKGKLCPYFARVRTKEGIELYVRLKSPLDGNTTEVTLYLRVEERKSRRSFNTSYRLKVVGIGNGATVHPVAWESCDEDALPFCDLLSELQSQKKFRVQELAPIPTDIEYGRELRRKRR